MSVVQRKGQVHGRSQIADFICPDNGYRGMLARKGREVKNHMKENREIIRCSETKIREDRERENQPPKDLYKLSQFRHVESRLHDLPSNNQQITRQASEGDFLTRGVSERRREDLAEQGRQKRVEVERKMAEAREVSDAPLSPRKNSVPRANETAKLAPRSNADFIERNRVKAQAMVPTRRSDAYEEDAIHEEFGRVPNYLEQRKAKWEEEKEEARRRAPDPNCPPGMSLMPEKERLDTLDTLHKSKQEAMRQLQALPFVLETPSLKRKQVTLEEKLREIDNAIGIFSKQKVFVARDN